MILTQGCPFQSNPDCRKTVVARSLTEKYPDRAFHKRPLKLVLDSKVGERATSAFDWPSAKEIRRLPRPAPASPRICVVLSGLELKGPDAPH